MEMSDEEARQVRQWSARVGADIEIRFQRASDSRAPRFEAFLDQISKLAPRVRVILEEEGESGLPGIVLADNLRLLAIPEGPELQPFLDLLVTRVQTAAEKDSLRAEPRGDPTYPATIKIYISPGCPHCPRAVSQIGPLAFELPFVDVTVIDGALFPELTARDGIRSAPTVLLDESFRWTGVAPREELLKAIGDRDPSQLSVESLKRMLKEGEADRLAAMILRLGRVFPAFHRLIDHPEWSVRLGAVVVMEELAEMNRDLARLMLEPVWDRIAGLDRSVKGDVAYLSGLVGSREWISRLKALREQEATEEIQEVVDEALEMIASREESP